MYDILAGSVRMNHLLGASFYRDISSTYGLSGQYILKRIIDIVVSVFALILLTPLYLFVAIKVMLPRVDLFIFTGTRGCFMATLQEL
jgi:lipopolysaccharide/colanic/teichoic acid biosynthesis glycosyltransferase